MIKAQEKRFANSPLLCRRKNKIFLSLFLNTLHDIIKIHILLHTMFLVFEGSDGSGTSTQAKLLAERLEQKGLSVFPTAEPSNHFLGKTLREVLQKKKTLSPKAFQLLFFADRQEHLQNEILPALQNGKIVICERYCWSSIAYGSSEGVSQDFLESLTSTFREPDYTFFMNLSPEESLKRIEKRGETVEHFETKTHLSKVQTVMTELSERCAFTRRASVLDASESIEKIASRIDMLLAPLMFSSFFEPQ